MKIELTSTAFYYISKQLESELLLGYINNVQTINKDVWKIKIHKGKTKQLIVTPEMCLLTTLELPVGEIGGFEKYLKKKLYNQRIHEIKQNKNNRLIYFKLDKYYLIFEFFSSSNIILTDLEYKIITSKQKEEWKDRTIQKGETYIFPFGKDLKETKKLELYEEIKSLNLKEQIILLTKKYNIAPMESKKIISENKKETIDKLYEIYNFKNPTITLEEQKEKKIVFSVKENKEMQENIFKELETKYFENFKEKKVEQKSTKKDKILKIIKEQENTKKEYEIKVNSLEKEGEFIYSYFNVVEAINKDIQTALLKKIPTKEIITKINQNLLKKNHPFEINNIDQKNKTYKIILKK